MIAAGAVATLGITDVDDGGRCAHENRKVQRHIETVEVRSSDLTALATEGQDVAEEAQRLYRSSSASAVSPVIQKTPLTALASQGPLGSFEGSDTVPNAKVAEVGAAFVAIAPSCQAGLAKEKTKGINDASGGVASLLTLFALSFHAFIDGVAIGLQQTRQGAVLLFVGIVGHKWAEGLALGVVTVKTPAFQASIFREAVFIIAFATMTPIGTAVGWGVSLALSHGAVGFLMAISAGTFLYLGLAAIVLEEFGDDHEHDPDRRRKRFVNITSFCLGAGLIYVLVTQLDA
jgi:zinc transporter ZupT